MNMKKDNFQNDIILGSFPCVETKVYKLYKKVSL